MAGKDGLTLEKLRSFWRRGRRLWAKHKKRQPRFFTPAFRVMYILTTVSAVLTWLSWRLMWYLPQVAKMDLIASTGVDPDTVTVMVPQDAYAIFAGLCALTLLCALIWLFVWLRKL